MRGLKVRTIKQEEIWDCLNSNAGARWFPEGEIWIYDVWNGRLKEIDYLESPAIDSLVLDDEEEIEGDDYGEESWP